MKINVRAAMAVLLAATAMIAVSCGGNGKQNQYIGKLPSIYADYQTEKDTLEGKTQKEVQKLLASGDSVKMKELKVEEYTKLKEMKTKFEADLAAEIKAIVDRGGEIPVSYSEKLKGSDGLFYTVATPVVLVGDNKNAKKLYVALKFTAPADTKLGRAARMRAVTSDGTTLATGSVLFKQDMPVSAGETIKEDNNGIISYIVHNPAEWKDFAGIEFITHDEFKSANNELRERHKN